ncbi:hypothetical protein [Modestobacter italicus]|uniref:hypothetical protein n=1 Tax=Modestobacter italicus (strain DSM 44449 / CECT 9708 / BC 501) TaxID=2732864 RepID=UPI001C96A475|nr:hypothetical protein [Modestobacter italicus]
MTSTPGPDAAAQDPFVRQVTWLVDQLGGRTELSRASGGRVSPRTLDYWCRGRYPRNAVTGAVRELDAWALASVPGYPGAAGAPRLVETCGPARPSPVTAPPTGPAVTTSPASTRPPIDTAHPDTTAQPDTTGPRTGSPAPPGKRSRGRRTRLLTTAATVVLAGAVATAVVAFTTDDGVDQLPPLPSTGDGTLVPETTGSIGANTFADPRALVDNSLPIPPDTTVQVRCRYYAPSIPSVVPDGFWYLVDSGEWAGRWSPANSFMNGDVPGERTLHNTDFAVPVCR